MFPTRHNRANEQGLTLIELVVVMVFIAIIVPVFASILIGTYRDAFYLNDRVRAESDASTAIWYIDDQVRVSKEFMVGLQSPFTDAYGARNLGSTGAEAWSYKGSSATSRVLITKSYATSVGALNEGRRPVFINDPDGSCVGDLMYYQPQLTFITVYFVKDGTLYRRVLTDRVTSLCAAPGNTQSQLQSCPPYITFGRHASCQANDEVLATNVSNFTVQYFQLSDESNSSNLDPNYTSTDPNLLLEADYVEVTLTTSTRNGQVSNTITQRMTKVNQ